MHRSLSQSIEYANQRSYLDDLFRVYPTIPEGIRSINNHLWKKVETSFHNKDSKQLVENLLKMDLFPIKDSYVAYLKRDKSALDRNPRTVQRLAGRLYEMGLNKIYQNCTLPKETNRQIGPMFKSWVNSGALGIVPTKNINEFITTDKDAILDAPDKTMKLFAKEKLGYNNKKGLDFLAKFNGKYVIGEAKFLTDTGGHQNAQFNDAITLLTSTGVDAIKIAVLDGVLYIPSGNKMYKAITEDYKNLNIMSALVLREFLYSL